MDFTNRIDIDLDVPSAIDAVTTPLKEQGFGVLTRIDVQQTFKDKLDVDTDPQVILGACNPQLAFRALTIDPVSPHSCPATSSCAAKVAGPWSRPSNHV